MGQTSRGENLYVNYSKHVDPHHLLLYDSAIISPYAEVDLSNGHQQGTRFYAYLSVGEIAPDAPYRARAVEARIPMAGTNAIWHSDYVDLSSPEWTDFVLGLAKEATAKGFDGFFLDTLDTVDVLCEREPERAEQFRAGLVGLVKKLKEAYPGKKIIVNRGFSVLDELLQIADGLLVESLFRTYDAAEKKYRPVSAPETEELLKITRRARAAGMKVYIVDYVDPDDVSLAAATAEKIEQLDYVPFVTTIDLQGRALAPLRVRPRFVLTLFGNQDEELENRVKWPMDSFMARAGQVVLEWLGYEVDYRNVVTEGLPPERLDANYCAVVLDRFLEVPLDSEGPLVEWLITQKNRGLKLIVLGDFPFDQDEPRARLLQHLGIGDYGAVVIQPQHVRATAVTKDMINFETRLRPLPNSFRNLPAPPDARVHLSLAAEDKQGRKHIFDPVFTAPWGGVAMDPYVTFQRPDFLELWILDPFRFFSEALQTDDAPVPDPTTRDGLRLFYTHIDGDGFGNISVVEPGKRSAEVIRDHIIKQIPFPITFSIIEAEVRGRIVGQDQDDEKELTALARSIFALPNVQAASHSYTHPFYWIGGDRTSLNYEGQNLVLRAPYNKEALDVQREIVGSVNYINQELCPPGKKVSVFLWSGNCRPGPEAIGMTKKLGIENMNGGETLISKRYPSITLVGPRVMMWNDEVQVFAANQNENEFNDDWQGPFYGGFIHTIETFKRTESPRRLKPMNIYFHIYSGDYFDSLKVLKETFHYVSTQQVHAVTASLFTRIMRDSHDTRIFRKGEHDWLVANDGMLRTLRVPLNGRYPDLWRCRGVTGFNEGQGVLYIHTDGSKKTEIVLSEKPRPHPYLVSSSAEMKFTKFTANELEFTCSDLRPIEVELAGFAPRSELQVVVNGQRQTRPANDSGRLKLTLPREAQVSVADTARAAN